MRRHAFASVPSIARPPLASALRAAAAAAQISDHLSFSREDPDDVKVKEISEILSVGDPGGPCCWRCRQRCCCCRRPSSFDVGIGARRAPCAAAVKPGSPQ
jgi:hypothetical protein